MKNLIEYINASQSNTQTNWYNSLVENVEYGIHENYTDLFRYNGAGVDDVLYKMNVYSKRLMNPNYVTESEQDVLFTIDEQFAARNMLITIANEYINSLYEDFANEYNIVTEGRVDESVKDFMNKVASKVKDGKDKMVQGFKDLGEKVKAVKEFIAQVMKNAIKTAKELVAKITEMMISFGESLQKLVQRLGGDEEEAQKQLKENIEAAMKDEKTSKENVYESFGIEINNLILENEYDDAAAEQKSSSGIKGKIKKYSKKVFSKDGVKMIGKAGLKMILQMMAYYAVTIVLPAIVTLIAGPLAGAIVEVLAKCIWSSAVIYKQVKDMYKTVKSEEYKKSHKVAKAFRWGMFFVSLGFAIWTAGKALNEAYEIGVKIFSGAADTILPSDVVQKLTEIFNSWYKSLTGKNAAGYDKLLETQNKVFEKVTEIVKNKESDFEKSEYDQTKTNNYDQIEKNGGKELADKLKDVNADDSIKSSKGLLDAYKNIEVNTGSNTVFMADVPAGGQSRIDWINNLAKSIGVKPENINIENITNTGLQQMTNGNAGTAFLVSIKGATDISGVKDTLGKGMLHMFTKAGSSAGTEIVQQITTIPADLFKVSFSAFGGLFPIAMKTMKSKGGFNLRLGSSRTGKGYHLYQIPANGVEEMTFNDAESKYGDKNPKAFAKMKKIVNENYKAITKYKEELEGQEKLSKEDKKKIKRITSQIEKMKEGSAEYKVLIFMTDDKFAVDPKEEKTTNEGLFSKKKKEKKEDKKELYPVLLFNPIMMACLDLANQTKTKGPRSNPYYVKGLFSRIEVIQMEGGMSPDEVVDMFTKLTKESLKACYDMTPDVPFTKDGKKYVVNDKSIWKENRRPDFGDFTNQELTDIFNDPDSVTKYLDGQYASGGQRKVEQTDTAEKKEKHDKAIAEYEKMMTDNEEVKEIINKNKTLKKTLLDDEGNVKKDALEAISGNLFRIEKNYLSKKKKKGFFAKLKDFFFGKKEDEESKEIMDKIDPEELKELALKCASVRMDKGKKKEIKEETTSESRSIVDFIEDDIVDEDFTILRANIAILEREWMDIWNSQSDINEDEEPEDLLS